MVGKQILRQCDQRQVHFFYPAPIVPRISSWGIFLFLPWENNVGEGRMIERGEPIFFGGEINQLFFRVISFATVGMN